MASQTPSWFPHCPRPPPGPLGLRASLILLQKCADVNMFPKSVLHRLSSYLSAHPSLPFPFSFNYENLNLPRSRDSSPANPHELTCQSPDWTVDKIFSHLFHLFFLSLFFSQSLPKYFKVKSRCAISSLHTSMCIFQK